MEPRIFVGLPCYSTGLLHEARPGNDRPSLKHPCVVSAGQGSILCDVFNALLTECLNFHLDHQGREQRTHFGMMHSDIIAPPGWADTLLDEMERTGADIVSTVIPLKERSGFTSTGYLHPGQADVRCLTLRQVYRRPVTFDAAGGGYPESILCVNTGLWLMRLTPQVLAALDGHGFRTLTRIGRGEDGRWARACLSEDWEFSIHLARCGLRVCATRAVKASHRGVWDYSNTEPWGEVDAPET